MHEQMLARYDAERRALGFGPVVPFADYREPIEEGYEDRPSGRRCGTSTAGTSTSR